MISVIHSYAFKGKLNKVLPVFKNNRQITAKQFLEYFILKSCIIQVILNYKHGLT